MASEADTIALAALSTLAGVLRQPGVPSNSPVPNLEWQSLQLQCHEALSSPSEREEVARIAPHEPGPMCPICAEECEVFVQCDGPSCGVAWHTACLAMVHPVQYEPNHHLLRASRNLACPRAGGARLCVRKVRVLLLGSSRRGRPAAVLGVRPRARPGSVGGGRQTSTHHPQPRP